MNLYYATLSSDLVIITNSNQVYFKAMDVDSSMMSSHDIETVEKGETNVKEEKVAADESVGVGVDEGVQVVVVVVEWGRGTRRIIR